MEVGEEGDYILIAKKLHCQCHHQNDSCIKRGRDESHLNVSLTASDSRKTCPQTTTFEVKGEPKWIRAYQPNALPLGQTGSR